jgi:ornithine decarboxylase
MATARSVLNFQSFTSQALSADEIHLIESSVEQFGAPLLMLDCDIIRQQYRALSAALPNVTSTSGGGKNVAARRRKL